MSIPFYKKSVFFLFLCSVGVFNKLSAAPGYAPPWGKDADLTYPQPPAAPPPANPSALSWLATKAIRFHQTILSPVDGPRSHFKPSSSEYMRQAIVKYGFFEGVFIGCDRLLRENNAPWVYRTIEVGDLLYKYDPVP